MLVHLILEGHLEEPVADKLLQHCGHEKGDVYGKKGFGYIQTKAYSFESLTRGACAVLVLTDLRDSKAQCPPAALNKYLLQHKPNPSPNFLFRFVEMELESWLLADCEAMAAFLNVPLKTIPTVPDKEPLPKQTLVNIARKSKKAAVKNAIVPPLNHGGAVGPGYLSIMTDFVKDHWRPAEAAKNSPSLKRCLNHLMELGQKN